MRPIPAVRAFTLTVGTTLAAVVVAPALSPEIGRRFVNWAVPGDAALQARASLSARPAQDAVRDGTSFAHGAIMGTLPSSASAPEELPGAVASNRASPFDREFRDLLDTLHKGSRQALGGRSLWHAIGGFLSLSGAPTGQLREETVLDPEFGEIALSLDMRLGLRHSAPSHGSENYRPDNSTLRAFETNLLADLERTGPATEFPNGSDYSVAPIGVNTTSSDGGSIVVSGDTLASSSTPGTNPGAVYLPPPSGWYGLPPSAPLSASYSTGAFGGGWQVATGPLIPPAPPIWSNFGPAPTAGNWNSSALHPKLPSVASIPTVPADTLAPSISSPSVAASTPVTGSGKVLSSSLVVAPAQQTVQSSFQPALSSAVVLNTTADTYSGSAGDYYNGQSFIAGSASSTLASVTIIDSGYTPVSPKLEVEARNSDGTIGSTLYTISGSANWSYSSSTHQLTFTAPTSFTLSANTGYWLIESDASAPGGQTYWDYSNVTTNYASAGGFSIPSSDATMANASDFDNGGNQTQYYPASIGPYLFSLSIAVPEPGSAALLMLGAGTMLLRRRRRSNPAV